MIVNPGALRSSRPVQIPRLCRAGLLCLSAIAMAVHAQDDTRWLELQYPDATESITLGEDVWLDGYIRPDHSTDKFAFENYAWHDESGSSEAALLTLDRETRIGNGWQLVAAVRSDVLDAQRRSLGFRLATSFPVSQSFSILAGANRGMQIAVLRPLPEARSDGRVGGSPALPVRHLDSYHLPQPGSSARNYDDASYKLGFIWNVSEQWALAVDGNALDVEDRIGLNGVYSSPAVTVNLGVQRYGAVNSGSAEGENQADAVELLTNLSVFWRVNPELRLYFSGINIFDVSAAESERAMTPDVLPKRDTSASSLRGRGHLNAPQSGAYSVSGAWFSAGVTYSF